MKKSHWKLILIALTVGIGAYVIYTIFSAAAKGAKAGAGAVGAATGAVVAGTVGSPLSGIGAAYNAITKAPSIYQSGFNAGTYIRNLF